MERRYKIFAFVVKMDELDHKISADRYLLCSVLSDEFDRFDGALEDFFLSKVPAETLDRIVVPNGHMVRISVCRKFHEPIKDNPVKKRRKLREIASFLIKNLSVETV